MLSVSALRLMYILIYRLGCYLNDHEYILYVYLTDEDQEVGSQDPPAAPGVDRDVPLRLQRREDDEEPEGVNPTHGLRR